MPVTGSFAEFLEPPGGSEAPVPVPSQPTTAALQLLTGIGARSVSVSELRTESGFGIVEFGHALEALIGAKLIDIHGAPPEETLELSDTGRALLSAGLRQP
jgi:hypothetical protein